MAIIVLFLVIAGYIAVGSVVELFRRPRERHIYAGRRSDYGREENNLGEVFKCFSQGRQGAMDVLWLKENAEALEIVATTCQSPDIDLREFYLPFYQGSFRHLEFFHPYYRFILSICMDLEDLGLAGDRSTELAEWVARQQLVGRELSDLQRAETRRQLARRGVELPGLGDLDDRLRAFASNAPAFAVQNRKTAYELTHIVFYLSEYGAVDPDLPVAALQSLRFVGLLAFLDQDPDLLSEACLALHFAGEPVPKVWLDWLKQQLNGLQMVALPPVSGLIDDYHAYFVMNWTLSKVVNDPIFGSFLPGVRSFTLGPRISALRSMSMVLYTLSGAQSQRGPQNQPQDQPQNRLQSWSQNFAVSLDQIKPALTEAERQVLDAAQGSVADFDAFFAHFATRGTVQV